MKKELKHYVKMGGFCNISDQKCDNLGAREMKKTGCIKKHGLLVEVKRHVEWMWDTMKIICQEITLFSDFSKWIDDIAPY